MRQNLLVFVPQEGGKSSSVSYSMYACGVKKEKPEFSADGKTFTEKAKGFSPESNAGKEASAPNVGGVKVFRADDVEIFGDLKRESPPPSSRVPAKIFTPTGSIFGATFTERP